MKSRTSTEILGTLANTVFRHGQARRTNVPFHHGEPVKEAQAELCTAMLELVGEDETLQEQSEYDKVDIPHPETDKYPGLHFVRQATRNAYRRELRTAIKNYFNQEDKKEL